MFSNLFFSIGIACAVSGGACCLPHNVNPSLGDTSPSNSVDFNDATYIISIGVDELNSWSFPNLANYFNNDFDSEDFPSTSLTYEGEDYSSDEFLNGDSLDYIYSDYSIIFDLNSSYNFIFTDGITLSIPFNNRVDINLNVSLYNDFKNAIELDIQANNDPMPTLLDILNDIVSLLTNGLIGMGNGLGGGINNFVTTLFVSNNEMSFFIGTIAIFGGIALAVGLTRRLFSWVCSLGAKN